MSYATIDLNGTAVGLKFGYQAIKWFTLDSEKYEEEYVITIDEKSQLTALGFADLLHCAYRNNMLLKKQDPVIELGEFYDWVVDKNSTPEGQQELKRLDTICEESKDFKTFQEQVEALKKKILEPTLKN